MVLLRSLSLDEQSAGPALLPDPLERDDCPAEGDLSPEAQAGAQADEEEEDQGSFLPDHCVKLVQAQLISGELPGVALLNLLSMASVCKQWRSLAAELAPGSAISFDGFDNLFSGQTSVQKFRRLTSQQKEQVFYGAARLLTGELLRGDWVPCNRSCTTSETTKW